MELDSIVCTAYIRKIIIIKKFARLGHWGKVVTLHEGGFSLSHSWPLSFSSSLLRTESGMAQLIGESGIRKERLTFRYGPPPATESWEPLPNPLWGKPTVAIHPSHVFHLLCFF